jgi:hypothetical protein
MSRQQLTGSGYSPNGALNAAWVGQFTVPVNVSLPIQSINGGVTGVQNLTVFDVPNSLANASQSVVANIPNGGGSWNYDTIEVAFNKRFGAGLFVDSSFDWTRNDDLRSPYAFTADPLQQSNPISPPDYFENTFPTVSNRQVTKDWRFQLSGRYELPLQFGVGANYQLQSGWNYAPIMTVNLPNAGTQQFWLQNLSTNRSDNVSLLNLRFDKAFTFDRYKVTGLVDLFNVLNANPAVNFQITNGPTFNKIVGLLDPRTLELGLRFEF